MFENMPLSILVDFDILVDLDWSICAYMWHNFRDSDYINRSFFERASDEVKHDLLYRKDINLIKLFIDGDTDDLFNQLLSEKEDDLLQFARVYDIMPLLVTIRNRMDYMPITIRCKNQTEYNYIKALNLGFSIKIIPEPKDVDLSNMAVLFTKYVYSPLGYNNVFQKHIYIAAAGYNMDEEIPNALNISVLRILADSNIFHTVDLYKDIHYII